MKPVGRSDALQIANWKYSSPKGTPEREPQEMLTVFDLREVSSVYTGASVVQNVQDTAYKIQLLNNNVLTVSAFIAPYNHGTVKARRIVVTSVEPAPS